VQYLRGFYSLRDTSCLSAEQPKVRSFKNPFFKKPYGFLRNGVQGAKPLVAPLKTPKGACTKCNTPVGRWARRDTSCSLPREATRGFAQSVPSGRSEPKVGRSTSQPLRDKGVKTPPTLAAPYGRTKCNPSPYFKPSVDKGGHPSPKVRSDP
jgi:hypothetical protein